jgi:diaminopimelate epimerase
VKVLDFKKMHGLGNDFVLIDARDCHIPDISNISKAVCSRNTGVGADGLIAALRSGRADIKMVIYNSDGSQAEMCGNGLRCFAKYVYQEGIVNKKTFSVDTLAGIMYPKLVFDTGGTITGVIVDMGRPVFKARQVPVDCSDGKFLDKKIKIGDGTYKVSAVRLGVPHSVVYVDDIKDSQVEDIGKAIENHFLFPEKTNVNFVRIIDKETIEVATWERGAGRTLACGTGSCAAAVISNALGKTRRRVKVRLKLGELLIAWKEDGRVSMEGPAVNVFSGRLCSEIYPLQS